MPILLIVLFWTANLFGSALVPAPPCSGTLTDSPGARLGSETFFIPGDITRREDLATAAGFLKFRGYSQVEIASYFSSRGITNPCGKSEKWSPSAIRHLLENGKRSAIETIERLDTKLISSGMEAARILERAGVPVKESTELLNRHRLHIHPQKQIAGPWTEASLKHFLDSPVQPGYRYHPDYDDAEMMEPVVRAARELRRQLQLRVEKNMQQGKMAAFAADPLSQAELLILARAMGYLRHRAATLLHMNGALSITFPNIAMEHQTLTQEAEANLEWIIRSNLRLYKKYKSYCDRLIEIEDIIGETHFALITAAKEFNPYAGTAFSTLAAKCIRSRVNHLKTFYSREQRKTLRLTRQARALVGKDGRSVDYFETVADTRPSSKDVSLKYDRQKSEVAKILAELTKEERSVMKYFYGVGDKPPLNKKEIGKLFGKDGNWVNRLHNQVLKKFSGEAKR